MKTWELLIVDDSPADRAVYRRYLARDPHQAYNITEAIGAEQGLSLCQSQQFDAVLLDFRLPGRSGLEVLETIKAHSPLTAVVMLTAYGDEVTAVNAMKRGAQDYLHKDDLNSELLQRTVRKVLNEAQLERHLQRRQEQQDLLTQIAFSIRQSLQLEETLETAVKGVRRLLWCDRVLIYQFAPDMSGKIIAESVGEGWIPVLGKSIEDTYFQTQGAEAYCQGRKQILADVYSADLDSCHLNLLAQFEVKAIVVIPILIGGAHKGTNHLWGLLVAHHCAAAREWESDEIHMLDELSIHASIAIRHAEMLKKTQDALEQEKELNTFKSQIVATVSHEYNSPLAAIQLAAETLINHQSSLDPASQKRFLHIIQQKTKHMSALVKDMLLVNQTEMKQLQLNCVPFSLGEFLSKLVYEQQILVGDKYELVFRLIGNIERFVGDRGVLRQVFLNLLTNAIKYSPLGGKIWIRLMRKTSSVICYIKDEGIGIPLEDQNKLFQPFSRGSNVGSINGTGLGLYIAKTAVELHGGTISVKSAQGKGSCFTVVLPVV